MQKSLIIIGAGTAGLAAGCYAQMNGFQTTLFEMHKKPGGLCTSWRRGGYLFDGSVAGLAGSAPGSPLYRLWQELGVADYCPLNYGENFGHIHHPDGRCVTIYADVDHFENHLKEMFPAEIQVIHLFVKGIRSVLAVDPPFVSQGGWSGFLERLSSAAASVKAAPALMKSSNISIRKFSEQAKDPFLQTVFQNIAHFGGLDMPLLTIFLPLAYAHRNMAGIPVKGWLTFARAIERRYLELGGKVVYGAKVERLVIENNKIIGVILSDGSLQPAELVLSTADGRYSKFSLPGRKEPTKNLRYQPENVSDQPMQVNLGVAMDLSVDNGPTTYLLKEPFDAGGKTHQ